MKSPNQHKMIETKSAHVFTNLSASYFCGFQIRRHKTLGTSRFASLLLVHTYLNKPTISFIIRPLEVDDRRIWRRKKAASEYKKLVFSCELCGRAYSNTFDPKAKKHCEKCPVFQIYRSWKPQNKKRSSLLEHEQIFILSFCADFWISF